MSSAAGVGVVQAETVRRVTDIDIRVDSAVLSSVKTEQGIYQLRATPDDEFGLQATSLWHTTVNGTVKVDIPESIFIGPEDLVATDKYLYFWERNGGTLWQLSLDVRQQLRQIRPDTPRRLWTFFSFPALKNRENALYVLEKEYDNSGGTLLGTWVNEIDEDTATLTRAHRRRLSGATIRRVSILGDSILLRGDRALWRVGRSTRLSNKIRNVGSGAKRRGTDIVSGKTIAYFSAVSGGQAGWVCDLWRTDGTTRGTFKLSRILSDPARAKKMSFRFGCNPETVIVGGNLAVFKKINTARQRVEIWQTQGTVASTRLLRSLPLMPSQRRSFDDEAHDGINLKRIGSHLWFTWYGRKRQPIVYTTDRSFRSLRKVLVGRPNAVIDLIPVSNVMFIQMDKDGYHSTLYKSDADGENLSKIVYGRNKLEEKRVVALGSQAIMPYSPPTEPPKEQLIGVDLASGRVDVIDTWFVRNKNSMGATRITEASDGVVFFCADHERDLGLSNRFGLWRTDGTSENTRQVIANLAGDVRKGCGEYAVSDEKVFYTRVRAGQGQELWSANLDGSEQGLLIDLASGAKSSKPANIIALSDALIFTAELSDSTEGERVLVRSDFNGNWETLHRDDSLEITGTVDQSVFFRTNRTPGTYPTSWSLWVYDATDGRVREVLSEGEASSFVKYRGEIHFAAYFPSDTGRKSGLYKLPAGTFQPTLVQELDLQSTYSGGYFKFSYVASKIAVYRDRLYFLLRVPATDYTSSYEQLVRLDVDTGQEAIIYERDRDLDSVAQLKSFVVFNNAIYFLVDDEIDYPEKVWRIWRSAGEPGDPVVLHEEIISGGTPDDSSRGEGESGILQMRGNAIWFNARNDNHGLELWQLTP